MSLRDELTAIWNDSLCQGANVCIWYGEEGNLGHSPGERRDPPLGKAATAVKRRLTAHYGPAPQSYCGDAKLVMPDWLRENYKRNCPNNYKTLIAEYGRGLSKLDAAVWKLRFSKVFGGENAD